MKAMTLPRLMLLTVMVMVASLWLAFFLSKWAEHERQQMEAEYLESLENLHHQCAVAWPLRGEHYEKCLRGADE